MIDCRSLHLAARVASLLALIIVGWAGPAFAHAVMLSSDPPDGILLGSSPTAVTLTFNEPVRIILAQVLEPYGGRIALGTDARLSQAHVFQLPPALPEGSHALSWRVVSDDGHPVGGALVFSVGKASRELAPTAIQTPFPVRAALWTARLLVMTGTAFGVGGIAFAALIADRRRLPRPTERIALASLGLTGLGAVALVGVQGLDLLGLPLDRIASPEVWRAGLFDTGYGITAAGAALAAALALYARQAAAPRTRQAAAAAALVLVGLAYAASGHAAAAAPQWLTRPSVFLHTVAVTFWVGALAPLAYLARAGRIGDDEPLRRFSDAIPFGLVALFGSGLALAGIQLGSLSALWTTPYGQVFLVKLTLLAALLAFALANRLRLAPSTLRGSPTDRRRLTASIATETVLAFGTLGVAGLWRFTVPPRSAPAEDPSVAVIEMSSGEAKARLAVRPARVGRVSLVIESLEVGHVDTPPLEVTVTLEKPSFGIGPFRKAVPPSPAGIPVTLDFFLPMDGFWVLRLEVLVDEFRKVSLTDIVSLSA